MNKVNKKRIHLAKQRVGGQEKVNSEVIDPRVAQYLNLWKRLNVHILI